MLYCRDVNLEPSDKQTVPKIFLYRHCTTKMSSLSINFAVTIVDQDNACNSVVNGKAGITADTFILYTVMVCEAFHMFYSLYQSWFAKCNRSASLAQISL